MNSIGTKGHLYPKDEPLDENKEETKRKKIEDYKEEQHSSRDVQMKKARIIWNKIKNYL